LRKVMAIVGWDKAPGLRFGPEPDDSPQLDRGEVGST
jgi:hypothetical protein